MHADDDSTLVLEMARVVPVVVASGSRVPRQQPDHNLARKRANNTYVADVVVAAAW